jgi:hypothetical protein
MKQTKEGYALAFVLRAFLFLAFVLGICFFGISLEPDVARVQARYQDLGGSYPPPARRRRWLRGQSSLGIEFIGRLGSEGFWMGD